MRVRQFLATIGLAFLGASLVASPAVAQIQEGDSGQFQILEARYGTASSNVDVTDKLRFLARTDQRFRVENHMLGADPAPGIVKRLRIHAQGRDGAVRIFEFEEGAIIDGAQFTGWERGEWGGGGRDRGWGEPVPFQSRGRPPGDSGEYRILHARYGLASSNIDVTERLREVAQQDRTVKIENRLFGNDPAPGRVKTLRIYARGPDGATRTFEYVEGGSVDGARFTGWGRGDWGRERWNGGWGEPAPVQASTRPPGDSGEYRILHARYGLASNNIDVTERLREVAQQDRTVKIENKLFGNDPAPGRVKTLRIYARGPDGATRIFEYVEGGSIDGARFTGWGRGDWGRERWSGGWGEPTPVQASARPPGDSGEYQILHARYGLASNNIDVTARLREVARQDRTVKIENKLFGNDPAPGRVKTLRIYARDQSGATRIFEYVEGGSIDGARFTGWERGDWGGERWNGGWGEASASAAEELAIVQATYGSGDQALDVTDRIRSMAHDGRLDIGIDNRTMGGDPSPGRRKQLSIVYSVGGRGQQEKRAWEQDRMQLP